MENNKYLVRIKIGDIVNSIMVLAPSTAEIDGILRGHYMESVVERGYSIERLWEVLGKE